MNLTQTEPALLIGLIGSIIVGALQQISDSGVVNGSGLQLVGLLITILPLIFGFITRSIVTSPATAAKLAGGTTTTYPTQP